MRFTALFLSDNNLTLRAHEVKWAFYISGISNGSNNSDNLINHIKNRFKDKIIGKSKTCCQT